MRIIAGSAKGRKILSPLNEGRVPEKGELKATRPTLDRVKESMFNIIAHKIDNARVLDLFAGTGSLGLETASRGAKEVVFLEKFKESYDLLVENIETLGFRDKSKTHCRESFSFIKGLGEEGEKFNIIFVDPPYLNQMVEKAILRIEEEDLLTEDGVIVSKYDKGEPIFTPELGKYELVDQRKYGNTILGFYQMRL
ncbi:MAG: 16S rRNA (guanine(966)-N(2))-methyltransferase RsmD [Clostridium sp.]|nr:16S rRNA (guanine(966)-N(2))-methyltransferase RsmD [Clostridium sp.]